MASSIARPAYAARSASLSLSGELRRAYELRKQLLAIAEEKQDATLLTWAHSFALIPCAMGEFTSARSHLERAISLYDPARSEVYRTVYSVIDPGVVSLGWSAITLCLLGCPDRALERSRQSLALARALAHPFSFALALGRSAQFHLLRREAEDSLSSANECLRVATEHGFEQMSAWAAVHRGMSLVELHQPKDSIVQLQDDVAAARATGYEFGLTYSLAALGKGYAKVGRVADGLASLAEGLVVSERNGERWFDAELYRIRGELLLEQDAHAEWKEESEAESSFRQALDIARA